MEEAADVVGAAARLVADVDTEATGGTSGGTAAEPAGGATGVTGGETILAADVETEAELAVDEATGGAMDEAGELDTAGAAGGAGAGCTISAGVDGAGAGFALLDGIIDIIGMLLVLTTDGRIVVIIGMVLPGTCATGGNAPAPAVTVETMVIVERCVTVTADPSTVTVTGEAQAAPPPLTVSVTVTVTAPGWPTLGVADKLAGSGTVSTRTGLLRAASLPLGTNVPAWTKDLKESSARREPPNPVALILTAPEQGSNLL